MTTQIGTLNQYEAFCIPQGQSADGYYFCNLSGGIPVFSDPTTLKDEGIPFSEIYFFHTSFPTTGYIAFDGNNLPESGVVDIWSANNLNYFPDGSWAVQLRSDVSLDIYYDDGVSVFATLSGGDYVCIGRTGSGLGIPGESYPWNMSCNGFSTDGSDNWKGTGTQMWVDTGIKKYGSGKGVFGFTTY